MEMFAQVIGFDPAGLGFKVAFAVQGVFVLMFIVAPIFGYLFLEKTKQLSSLWLALFSGLFVAVVTHTGLMWLLRKAIPPAQLSDTALALLAGGGCGQYGPADPARHAQTAERSAAQLRDGRDSPAQRCRAATLRA